MVQLLRDRFPSDVTLSSLLDLLQFRAMNQPEEQVYTFLSDGETQAEHLTYRALYRQAQAIAHNLSGFDTRGKPVLLLYPSGLDFIAAFWGCLYAGAIAVPAPLPRSSRSVERIQAIAQDIQTSVILTTRLIEEKLKSRSMPVPALAKLRWISTDTIAKNEYVPCAPVVHDLAFIQYTSGSTRVPRGVLVSHTNLLSNLKFIAEATDFGPDDRLVSWLPSYHDMGLVMLFLVMYVGCPATLMSPSAFIQRPSRWLEVFGRNRATFTIAPNFAYDLCSESISEEELTRLDLHSWTLAACGSEPVRYQTLKRFSERFAICGFREESFFPCYGLAEATLMVSGGPGTSRPFTIQAQREALERNQVIEDSEAGTFLVGCGKASPENQVVIVDHRTCTRCPEGQVGEIWVCGPAVSRGYWNKTEETRERFSAYLAGTGEGPFLRTGDQGFIHQEQLFVTGRIKDVIVIRGSNFYPEDIEFEVERCHPALQGGGCVVFCRDPDPNSDYALIIVQEVKRQYLSAPPINAIIRAIRGVVAERFGLRAADIVLTRYLGLPRTTSGKKRRQTCTILYLNGQLDILKNSEAFPDASGE